MPAIMMQDDTSPLTRFAPRIDVCEAQGAIAECCDVFLTQRTRSING